MRIKHVLLFTSCFFLAAAMHASVPLRFDIETSEARTRYLDAMRGETVDLELPMLSYGRPLSFTNGTPAAVWWQTNGMGSAWWSAPATVSTDGVARASWTPAMDCGADRYALFVGVGGEDGRSYRAAFAVRMRGAPGPHPNEIAPLVQVLDFAKIAYTNEPWSSSGLSTNDVRALIEADAGPTNRLLRISEDGDLTIGTHIAVTNLSAAGAWFEAGRIMAWGAGEYGDGEGSTCLDFPANTWGTIAVREDIAAATNGLSRAADVNAAEIAAAASARATLEMLYTSSNVVAEVTNYNSSVRAPSLRLLQLDQANGYQTVWAETNGLARTLASAGAYADAATNALARAKADRAWGKYTSGLGADAPEGVTWVSTPETVIAGGYEYAKYISSGREVWVLTSNGLTAGADTNAYFRVATGDGETLFSIEKTDSVLIGVDADGITVSGGAVTIPLSVVSQDPPVCYAANSLVNATWIDLSDSANWPAWVTAAACTGTSGAWVWTIQSTAPSAFFQFRALQEGGTVIRNNAQTDLSQGIIVNGTRFYPHVSGGTLTWTTTP